MGPGQASPIVRWLARAVSRIFYRVDQAGHLPAEGAVLLLPNHPNALLDPAVVWATAGRDVRFLAKSTLFEGAFAPVLKGAGAIPVYRRLHQGVDPSRNTETFEAVDAALAAGQAICIFPEASATRVIFWVPYQMTGLLARRATKARDVAATATVLVGAAVHAAWLAILVAAVWLLSGSRAAAAAAALVLPVLALGGLFAVEREASVIDTARSWRVLRRARGQSRARLRQERSEIATLLDEVYEWLNADASAQAAAQRPS